MNNLQSPEVESRIAREVQNEARMRVNALLENASNAREVVDTINRGTRSQLVSKKLRQEADLFGLATNCFGSLLHLQKNLSKHDIELTPALVMRYPWQQSDSCREIHLVGIVQDESGTKNVIVTDPTPTAGYSYGTTRVGELDDLNAFSVSCYDETLGGSTDYKILSAREFAAIRNVYEYEVSSTPEEYSLQTLYAILAELEDVPGYKTRMLYLLNQREGEKPFRTLINQLPPTALRKSYTSYLDSPLESAVMDIAKREEQNKKHLIPSVSQAIDSCVSVQDYNYWSAVKEQFAPAATQSSKDLSYLNPRYFAKHGSRQPIKDYEMFMTEHAPHAAVSNLYTPDWR